MGTLLLTLFVGSTGSFALGCAFVALHTIYTGGAFNPALTLAKPGAIDVNTLLLQIGGAVIGGPRLRSKEPTSPGPHVTALVLTSPGPHVTPHAHQPWPPCGFVAKQALPPRTVVWQPTRRRQAASRTAAGRWRRRYVGK